jgi:hypothetical protein
MRELSSFLHFSFSPLEPSHEENNKPLFPLAHSFPLFRVESMNLTSGGNYPKNFNVQQHPILGVFFAIWFVPRRGRKKYQKKKKLTTFPF